MLGHDNINTRSFDMQVINKTGLFGSKEVRVKKSRYGFSMGASFLGLHLGKRSLYIEMFTPPKNFGGNATVLSL